MSGSLSRQLLGWQLVIIIVLLAAISALVIAQSAASFRATEGRRMLSVAEDLAATAGVRVGLTDPYRSDFLPVLAESAASLSGADYIAIADPDGTVLTSPDPDQKGDRLPLGRSTVLDGRSWVGGVTWDGEDSLVAHVPIVDSEANIIGLVAAGREKPDFFAGIARAPLLPVAVLAFATLLSITGSVLLAKRVKRQTLGLEPSDITRLVEHREALLHGIREGVLGVDEQNRITLVNDQARTLLSLPDDCLSNSIDELELNDRARDVLTGRTAGTDQIVLRRGRTVVLNRMPISSVGAVVTMRDRTELVDLQRELAANKHTTDTLRAQAHEFTNRLHTISGLIELGEYDDLQRYVARISHTREQWHSEVGTRINDPAIAALLIAKSSLAAERGVGLRLHENTYLAEIDEEVSGDLVTVLGNFVNNALDALTDARARSGEGDWIEVDIRHGSEVTVTVRDSGPGIAPEIAEEVFRHGFSTKAASDGERGLGLALTRQICRRRGGSVDVHNAQGAVFTARFPIDVDANRIEVPAAGGPTTEVSS